MKSPIMFPATMTEMFTTMGSTLASFMFVWAIIRQYCPYELRRFFEKYTQKITGYFYPYIRISSMSLQEIGLSVVTPIQLLRHILVLTLPRVLKSSKLRWVEIVENWC